MSLAQRDAAVREILNSVEEPAAVQYVIERRWNKTGLVFVAEPPKDGILARKSVVHSDVKIVAGFAAHGDGDVIESRIDGRVRGWDQSCQPGGQRVHGSGRENICWVARAIHPYWKSAESSGVGGCYRHWQGSPGVEDFPHKGLVIIAIKSHSPRREAGVRVNGHCRHVREKLGEIADHHVLIRKERGLWYSLPQAKSFVIDEEECLVLLDRAAKCSPELVLLVRWFLRCDDEEWRSIKNIISQIFENISVITVGAGFDYGI